MARNTYAAELEALWRGASEARESRRADDHRKAVLAETVRSNKQMENIALEKLAQSEKNIRVSGGETRRNIATQGGVDLRNIDARGNWQSRHIGEDYAGKSKLSEQGYRQDRGLRNLDFTLGSQRDTHQDSLLRNRMRLDDRIKRGQMELGGIIEGGHIDKRGGWRRGDIFASGREDRRTQGQKYDLMKDYMRAEYGERGTLQDKDWSSKFKYLDKDWNRKDSHLGKEYTAKGLLDKAQNVNRVQAAKDLAIFGEEDVQADEVTKNMLIESGAMPETWDGKIPRNLIGKINQGAFGLMGYQSMYDKELARATAKIETAAPLTEPAIFDQLDDPLFTDEGEVMSSIQASVDSFYNAGPGGVTGAEKLKRDPSGEWSKAKMTDLKNIYQGLNNPTLKGSGWFEISDNSQNVGRKRDSVLQLMKMNWKAQGWSPEQISKEISSMDKKYYDGKKYYDINKTKESGSGKGALSILKNNKGNDKVLQRRISTLNSQIAKHTAKGDTTSSQYYYHVDQLNKLLDRQGK